MADEHDSTELSEEVPADHPLAGWNGILDDHESHVNAIADYLDSADPEDIRSLMLVVTTNEPHTETIPTIHPDAEFDERVFVQLAAHVSHVADAFDAAPETVARHACHVLRDPNRLAGGDA